MQLASLNVLIWRFLVLGFWIGKKKLIGFGCDGASVNIGANGLRRFLEDVVSWIICFWCLAHRLQLTLKDALDKTLCSTIDDMLLHLYYLYEISPKKCRELNEIVESLQMCLDETEMSLSKGNRPMRSSGTRFVSHKVAALNRFMDKFGAYLSHLTSLTHDPSVNSLDKARLTGYMRKGRDGKMILWCALFHYLLKPCSILSKALQDDNVSIIDAIQGVVKTNKSIEQLKATSWDDFPSVKKVISRITTSQDGISTYQATNFAQGLAHLRTINDQLVDSVVTCLKN